MKYRLARRTAWRAIADETIVLDLATSRMYGLNESAAFVWRTLETMDDFESLFQAMAIDDPAFGADDIEAFCEELVDLGLLEAAEPEKPSPTVVDPLSNAEPPRILWQETLEEVAASCAFLPGQSALCNQVPSA